DTIALRSNVPLVPAAYIGPSSVKKLIKGKKAQLVFGYPIQIDAGEQIYRKTSMKMMKDQLN
ncbi:1-acyl-sn-glycerol-3-phosphate acyltransferase, partial [Bacillus cereus group sp. N3]|nr:1-acyl-sn-glycerol-3-phosphate acyltransferase [Bacillus cereus group sp. N3]